MVTRALKKFNVICEICFVLINLFFSPELAKLEVETVSFIFHTTRAWGISNLFTCVFIYAAVTFGTPC